MLVFGGLPISESMDFFTSMNGRIGIINQAAQLLLRSNTISSSNNNTTVTLSWYKIDNKGSENISDLLRMSSSLHSNDKGGADKDSNLVLRELGKGRGMIVPGLWEVEVSKPQDVDAVISHVQRMIPMAKHDGKSHSVFQLSVTPNDSFDDDSKKSKLKEDAADIGRLTIVLLSDISVAPSSSDVVQQHLELCPWVRQLEEILKWIDSKRPSPPFHKSRILLLLRDALCTRMTCGISLFLQPTVDSLSENSIWLQLLSHISSMSAERSSAINTLPIHSSVSVAPMLAATSRGSSMTKEQALIHNATSLKPRQSTPSASIKAKPRFNASGNTAKSATKSILKNRKGNSKESINEGRVNTPKQSRRQQGSQSAHDNFFNQLPLGDDMSAPHEDCYGDDVHSRDFDRHSHGSSAANGRNPPTPSQEDIQQQQLYQHQLRYQRQFYEQQHMASGRHGNNKQHSPQHLLSPPPPPPAAFKKTSTTDHQNHNQQQQQSQSQQQQRHQEINNQTEFEDVDNAYDNSLLPPQMYNSGGHHNDENVRPRDNESNGRSSRSRDDDDRKEAETVEALLFSLQSSRDEVESLKKSLLLCQQSLEFHKTEHELLKSSKDGAGQTLKAKDRDRLKKALQELKDYEVYREVMEAAMSRMQNEIDKLESDNAHHKQMTAHLEKELRKSKNIANKITRETSDFEKSKVTLHERVSTAEKEARRLSKERDAAVLALSQYKAEKARDEEDLKSSRRVKHKEVLELKKKLTDLSNQFKMATDEHDTASELHAQDLKKLQVAHKKSLEMLMACQEENDLLRAAVAELEDEAAKASSTKTGQVRDQAQESQGNRQAPSPLGNLFPKDGPDSSVEDEAVPDKTTKKAAKKGYNSDGTRRKTIVFVDDYENGDVYIEDESSVLTGDTESLSSNIEISQKKTQGKIINLSPNSTEEGEED